MGPAYKAETSHCRGGYRHHLLLSTLFLSPRYEPPQSRAHFTTVTYRVSAKDVHHFSCACGRRRVWAKAMHTVVLHMQKWRGERERCREVSYPTSKSEEGTGCAHPLHSLVYDIITRCAIAESGSDVIGLRHHGRQDDLLCFFHSDMSFTATLSLAFCSFFAVLLSLPTKGSLNIARLKIPTALPHIQLSSGVESARHVAGLSAETKALSPRPSEPLPLSKIKVKSCRTVGDRVSLHERGLALGN